MKIDSQLASHRTGRESALTIGVFDGVHLGHRHLISRLREVAGRSGRLSGVLTFNNHPASVLRPDFLGRYLTSLDDRLCLLAELGPDLVLPVSFDLDLSRLAAREFVALLQDRLLMKDLVVGPDFAMGHNREGDAETLADLGSEMGFTLHVVEPLLDDAGHAIRSTHVRDTLAEGDISTASELLGRNFTLRGVVESGEGRGGPLGFPTANLGVRDGMAVPADGIYATWGLIAGDRHMAATSIGVRPTFGKGQRTIEAFVLDYEGDLYGQQIGLEFVSRLRPEIMFDSGQELQEQVRQDVAETRAVLEGGQVAPGSEVRG
jgi:riboflavin kinase/FMN adenylyltransferase